MRYRAVLIMVAFFVGAVLAAPVFAQPANDRFADALPVEALPFLASVDVSGATVEAGEPDEHCAPVANTVWYAVTLPQDAEVVVNTAGSDFDTVLGVFTGTELGDLQLVACNDDIFASLQARVVFAATAGTTYWVQAGAFLELDEGGQLEIAFRQRVPGDGVTCDADLFDDDELSVYEVAPGDTVTCTAVELDVEAETSWNVEFFDLFTEFPPEQVGSVGETGLQTGADGTLAFEFEVPDGLAVGAFFGVVTQGAAGEETYFEEFVGLIFGLGEGAMSCAPDPVERGKDVECVVEEFLPGDFDWQVHFLSAEQLADLFDGGIVDDEDFGEFLLDGDETFLDLLFAPDLEGVGTVGDDGAGSFDFAVPAEAGIDAYLAIASQEHVLTVYLGDVVAPVDKPKPSDGVVVERPVRVDTGAGGTTPSRPVPVPLLLVGLGLAVAAGRGLLAARR